MKQSSPPRWTKKVLVTWRSALAVIAAGLTAILLLKVVSFMLPEPKTVLPKVAVSIGQSDAQQWHLDLKDASGSPLQCHNYSAGLLSGWECESGKIYLHNVTAVENPALAIRRIMRAAYLTSSTPKGTETTEGRVTTITLTHEEAQELDPKLGPGDTILGAQVTKPSGWHGASVIIVATGETQFVRTVIEQVVQGGRN